MANPRAAASAQLEYKLVARARTPAYVNTEIYLLRFTIAKHVAESGRQDPKEETMTTNSWCVMTMAISET